jgi:hypothetical protein
MTAEVVHVVLQAPATHKQAAVLSRTWNADASVYVAHLLAGKDDPSAVLVLMEGGEVALHDLSNFAAAAASAEATAAAAAANAAAASTPARSSSQGSGTGSPTRQRLQQQGLSPRRSAGSGSDPSPFKVLQGGSSSCSVDPTTPAAPQRLFTQKLQGQPLVTAARLRIIPIDRVPLQGLQVRQQQMNCSCMRFLSAKVVQRG